MSQDLKRTGVAASPLSGRVKSWFPMIAYFIYAVLSISFTFAVTLFYAARKCGLAPIGLCIVLLFGLASLFVRLANRHANEKDILFLLVGVPAGVAFCLFILPGNVPDEYPHVWQVAALFSRSESGFMVPAALNEANTPRSFADMHSLLTSTPNWENTFLCGRCLSSYLPFVYIIASVPMYICRALGVNEYIAFYLARFANLTFFLMAAFLLIRYAKFGKRLLLVYFLNPMLIQQESSCSADAVINVVLFAFVIVIISAYNVKRVPKRLAVCLAALSVLLCLSKTFAYSPMLLLLLLLIPERVGTWKRSRIWACVIAIGVVMSILTIALYRGPFMRLGFDLLRSPASFIKVMLKTIWEMGPFWVESFAGYNLGALSINVWRPCFWAYLVLLAVVSLDGKEEHRSPFRSDDRALLWLIAGVNIVLICLSMRGWTVTVDGRTDIFMGVQGRYLIPLIFLPLFSTLESRSTAVVQFKQTGLAFAMAAIFSIDMLCIIQFF